MTSYLTQEEIEALKASSLRRDAPFLIRGVSHSQFSIARHYGGATFVGWHYTYMPAYDELVRDDVVKWVKRRRKVREKAE